ncbi:unnamed protein product [Meganyctiphanes norvegica]|uniref:Metalloendopeptidase n=1 Tax=Meganyctiphanes norvegica TaxID=48144 RepID=A0AAV2R686_MEGNR
MFGIAILTLLALVAGQPFEMSNPSAVAAGELYQSDMLMSEEQWDALRTRKALDNKKMRWTEGSDGYPLVPYVFMDSVNQDAVKAGINHWMEHTCIKFEETSNTDQPHLQISIGSQCWSAIGMWHWENGQKFTIAENCHDLGIVAHELGHTIGFYHEQNRLDRDDYVTILMDNVEDDRDKNFVIKVDSNNYNVPYDYSSIMHYGSYMFSKNEKPTIVTKDPLASELIGSRNGLTHRDKLLANRMYNCIGKWLTKCGMSSDPCLNDGYTGKDCTCVCPPGTEGSNCEDIVDDYYAQLRSPLSEKITTEKSITIETPMEEGTKFVKWIVPPTCNKAKVTFTSSHMTSMGCKYQNLNVKTDPMDIVGDRMCTADVQPGVVLTSDTGIIITMINDVTGYDYSGRTLWAADVTFETIPGCSDPNPPTTPAPTNPPTPAPTNPPTPAPTNPPTPAPTNPPTPAPTTAPVPTLTYEKRPQTIVISKGTSVTITSPGFPSSYSPDKISCGWKLKAETSSLLTITCEHFELNGKDKIQISKKSYQGKNATSLTSNSLSIKFNSKQNSTGAGFQCTVNSN